MRDLEVRGGSQAGLAPVPFGPIGSKGSFYLGIGRFAGPGNPLRAPFLLGEPHLGVGSSSFCRFPGPHILFAQSRAAS